MKTKEQDAREKWADETAAHHWKQHDKWAAEVERRHGKASKTALNSLAFLCLVILALAAVVGLAWNIFSWISGAC